MAWNGILVVSRRCIWRRNPDRSNVARTHSKQRIVEAAIEILDGGGEGALTFRTLAATLTTGSGAIYWHVTDKHELLAAATDHIIACVMTKVAGGAAPQDAIRKIALGVFDAIDAHP